MSMAPSNSGFLLLDARLNLIASNGLALQILCFPSEASRMKQPKVFMADHLRTTLLDHTHQGEMAFVKEFKSGKRRYICKSFQVACWRKRFPATRFRCVAGAGCSEQPFGARRHLCTV